MVYNGLFDKDAYIIRSDVQKHPSQESGQRSANKSGQSSGEKKLIKNLTNDTIHCDMFHFLHTVDLPESASTPPPDNPN